MNSTKEDNIVGKQINIFDVLYECDFKTKDGHKMYHVKCRCCQWEGDMKKHCIRRTTSCKHVDITGKYIDYNLRWKSKRLKSIFGHMKQRCYNVENKDYRWYGNKGIRICDEWINNPKLFEEWSFNNGYSDNLTIDRKDENKDYSPDNCRWITLETNTKYKSTTSLIEVNGETHTGREWAEMLGLGTNVINTYVRKYGQENTIEFIQRFMVNPSLKPKVSQSYYDLYMDNQSLVI